MTSVGDALRCERLRRGLKLEQVAAETKIRVHLLQAMEHDRFDQLPAGLLTRSFLRQYAHRLGLDEDEIIASFMQQSNGPVDPLPKPPPEGRSMHLSHPPELIWVLAAVLACAGIFILRQNGQPTVPQIKTVLPRPASQPDALVATPGQPPTRAFHPAAISDSGLISMLPSREQAQAHEVQPVRDGSQAMRVAFTAIEPVWLSIKSDGTEKYCGTLGGQQSKEFDASNKMTVLIGNAGGLIVSLNGKLVGPIGAHGQVLRLTLTPNGTYVVPRTPSPPTPTSEDQPDRL